MNYRQKILEEIRWLVFGYLPERHKSTQHPSHFEIGRYGHKFYIPKDETLGKGARRFNRKAIEAGLIAVTDIDIMSDEDLFDLFCWVQQRYSKQM